MTKEQIKKHGYQRNKYLEDLGIPIENYGTNFLDKTDDRWKKWKKERKKYGFDSRECWNFDTTFIEWLYCHLMKYKDDCKGIVELTAYSFEYDDGFVTQEEAIDIICDACKEYLLSEGYNRPYLPTKIMILLGNILPAMWW